MEGRKPGKVKKETRGWQTQRRGTNPRERIPKANLTCWMRKMKLKKKQVRGLRVTNLAKKQWNNQVLQVGRKKMNENDSRWGQAKQIGRGHVYNETT